MPPDWTRISILLLVTFVILILLDFLRPGLLVKFSGLGTVAIGMFTFLLWHLEVQRESVRFELEGAEIMNHRVTVRLINSGRRDSAVQSFRMRTFDKDGKGDWYRAEEMTVRSVGSSEDRASLVVQSGDHVLVSSKDWVREDGTEGLPFADRIKGEDVELEVSVIPVLGEAATETFTAQWTGSSSWAAVV